MKKPMKTSATRTTTISDHFFAAVDVRINALRADSNPTPIIRLDIGSPDLPPAPHIIETLTRAAARPDSHGYQPIKGTPALREAWAALYQRLHNVTIDPTAQVLPLLGSKEGIFHLSQALLEPGDVALIPEPAYMSYVRGARFAGAEPFIVPSSRETGFLPDLTAIPADVLSRARLLWLNFPNNPTSAVASREFFASAVEFARRHDILLVSDAAYTQVTYDGYYAPSLLEIPGALEVAIEFNTLSKSHNMAGWRTAVAVGNADVLKSLGAVEANVNSGGFKPILEASIAALTGDQSWLGPRNQIYQRRRDLVIGRLRELGLEVDLPQASLYAWFKLPGEWKAADFTDHVLQTARVSLTPGSVFGTEGYARLAFCSPDEELIEALNRLQELDIW
jgi:LL-diaminopimelate aminotransferase